MGRKGNFHADMLDESYRKKFNGALKQELGVYSESCNIYVPYYRQITFPVYSLETNLREDCIELAYQDVSKALTGCYIDPVRGTLKAFDIMPEDYSNNLFPNGIYHLNDYQFFYRNLQENVKVRIKTYQNN